MNNIRVSFFDIILTLPWVIDMVSPELEGHHRRVAYIAVNIAKRMGLSDESIYNIFLASVLHDCGALSLRERIKALAFDADSGSSLKIHAELGGRLLSTLKPLSKAASIVQHHHTAWSSASGVKNTRVPLESFVLHLADRADVLASRLDKTAGLENVGDVIKREYGGKFVPESVDALISLVKERKIVNYSTYTVKDCLQEGCFRDTILNGESLFEVTQFIERITDFRSRFTATHSSGVAAVSEELGKIIGFSDAECRKIKIAGYLHDLGKLAVPAEYLEKPGKLTKEEYEVVKRHAYYSYKILGNIKGLEEINQIASCHHERLTGNGYPFGLDGGELSVKSRIMCVTDVFTAITEDRPYRAGMERGNALKVLKGMVEDGSLDKGIVDCLTENYDKIDAVRLKAQSEAIREYEDFLKPAD